MPLPVPSVDAPPLSVVVTTHQRQALLPALLAALLADPATAEVVVVADGCTDGTDELVADHARRDPRVRLLALHPNRGQPRARAAGVEATSRDVVLSLDDDVLPAPGLTTGHARAHAAGGVDVVLGYMPTRLPEQRGPGQFATYEYAHWYEQTAQRWERDPDTRLTLFWAGNFSVRRELLRTVLDGDDFPFRYHEDADLGLRLRRAGARADFDRTLLASHQHSRDWRGFLREARSAGQGRTLLAQRWPLERPYDPEGELASGGLPVRALARLAGGRAALTASLAGLQALTAAAGRTGRFALEDRASQLAKQLALRDAARAVAAAPAG